MLNSPQHSTPDREATGSQSQFEARAIVRQMSHDYWRLTPATLLMHVSRGTWMPAKHLLHIASVVASALAKGSARIAICCPPRHGKSELISYGVPLWTLDKWPHWPIIHTSYGADLSTHFTRKVRDELDSNTELNVTLDVRQADQFTTTLGGGMRGSGINGPISGFGAMLLLFDDIARNFQDGTSQTVQDATWYWFVSVAMNRLNPDGSCIIATTRWSKIDLVARLNDPNYVQDIPGVRPWQVIEFPALAYEDDALGRKPGEPLWPERYDLPRLHEICAMSGGDSSYVWQAVMQQKPISRGDSTLSPQMFQIVEPKDFDWEDENLRFTRAWDLAATPEKGDYISGALLAENRKTHAVTVADLKHDRIDAKEIEELLTATAAADPEGTQIWIEQEGGSSGKILIDHYCRVVLKGFSAHGEPSTGNKFSRAQPLLACIQNRNFYILRANWNQTLINEFMGFPDTARHDDIVDSCSLGYNKLIGRRRYGGATWGHRMGAVTETTRRAEGKARRKARVLFGCTLRP